MGEEINFNYAATSARKPDASIKAMMDYLGANSFSNPSRGGEASLKEGRLLLDARISLARLFHMARPECVIFTPNVTTALNMVVNGMVTPGMHVLSTGVEHNAVARPLEYLKEQGVIELTYLPVTEGVTLDPEGIEPYIKSNTGLFVMTHASNVTGAVLPYEACAKIAKKHGIFFVLDAAQTAGLLPIDFDLSDIDVLAFTGHKSLMGPTGTGGFLIKPEAAKAMRPFLLGGTGSASHLLSQPEFMPDKFESGTPNIPGIIGLGAAVDFILETGVEAIFAHEQRLTRKFMEGIAHENVIIYGPPGDETRMPVVSFNIRGMDNGILGETLYEDYGIAARSGLHCSPLSHKSMGTYPEGALRVSFGYFTTEEEVEQGVAAIKEILSKQKPTRI